MHGIKVINRNKTYFLLKGIQSGRGRRPDTLIMILFVGESKDEKKKCSEYYRTN
jgi:hypothetical protein